MRLRNLSLREIVRSLETEFPRPDTGKSWGLSTIKRDVDEIEKEWRQAAIADVGQAKQEMLARIAEVERLAWQQKDLTTLLRAVEQRCKLLGLYAPAKQDIVGIAPSEVVVRIIREGPDARS